MELEYWVCHKIQRYTCCCTVLVISCCVFGPRTVWALSRTEWVFCGVVVFLSSLHSADGFLNWYFSVLFFIAIIQYLILFFIANIGIYALLVMFMWFFWHSVDKTWTEFFLQYYVTSILPSSSGFLKWCLPFVFSEPIFACIF